MEEHAANKHLTLEERQYIEIGLDKGRNFVEISNELNKHRTTIMREVQKRKFKKIPSSFNNSGNRCKHRFECKKFECDVSVKCYEEDICHKLLKPPYVCNSCEEKRMCRKVKYYYYAKFANNEYEYLRSESRYGINLSKEEIYELDKLISPLLKENKQTIAHIYNSHPDEIWFSRATMYNYIDLGVFTAKNLDLPRKVKYKKRKKSATKTKRREMVIRQGRTYDDFKEYVEKHPDASIVEMDTVEGVKGGKVFLTLLLRQSKFMFIFLLDEKTTECVTEKFKQIQKILGKDLYEKVFEVVLTDNGSEFFEPLNIEKFLETKEIVTHLFYCNPSASWQKGAIEKNHEYIRYVLPKGTSFDELTQEQVDILMNNINSTSRDSLNGKTPFEAVQLLLSEDTIAEFGGKKIAPNQVSLSPKILKAGEN